VTNPLTCSFPPFVSTVVAQKRDLDSAASAMELFQRQLEGYLKRLLAVLCTDLQNAGGGGGVTKFIELSDVPASYAGAAGFFVKVKPSLDGLEFIAVTIPTTFLGLSDTPASYAGAGGFTVKVNAAANALEFDDVDSGSFQQSLGQKRFHLITAANIGSAASPSLIGIGMAGLVIGSAGTAVLSFPALASTNAKTSRAWARYTTATANNSNVAVRENIANFWRGNAANLGGFTYYAEFSVNTTNSTDRIFLGLLGGTTTVFSGAANPSSFVDMIGVGYDGGDSNLQIMTNDSSGTATKTDLGANFPARTTTAVYRVKIVASPNASSLDVTVDRLDSAFTSTLNISADLPTSTTMLAQIIYCGNGVSGAIAAAIDFAHPYCEPGQ
jgi:hypothetical protein